MFKFPKFFRSNDLSQIEDICRRVAEGDFNVRILNINPGSKYCDISNAINRLIDRSDAYVRETSASLDKVSQNIFYRRISKVGMTGAFKAGAQACNTATSMMEERGQNFRKVVKAFEDSTGKVIESVSKGAEELDAMAIELADTANATSDQSMSVSSASEQASSNVQSVAAAAEELTNAVSEIGSQVEQSSRLSESTVKETAAAQSRIGELTASSARIGEVVSLISEIASQTNLLALNATIEAARAGDAGKGFAVVASEVKALASQTSKATDDISRQIDEIQTATTNTVESMSRVSEKVGEMGDYTAAISVAVDQQNSATKEIAHSIDQAAAGTNEVTKSIASVSDGAKHSNLASGRVKNEASNLTDQSQRLGEEVTSFLEEVARVV